MNAAHSIACKQLMVTNEVTVIAGSFNFREVAEGNTAENLLILHKEGSR